MTSRTLEVIRQVRYTNLTKSKSCMSRLYCMLAVCFTFKRDRSPKNENILLVIPICMSDFLLWNINIFFKISYLVLTMKVSGVFSLYR